MEQGVVFTPVHTGELSFPGHTDIDTGVEDGEDEERDDRESPCHPDPKAKNESKAA